MSELNSTTSVHLQHSVRPQAAYAAGLPRGGCREPVAWGAISFPIAICRGLRPTCSNRFTATARVCSNGDKDVWLWMRRDC